MNRVANVLLGAIVLSTGFLDYWSYSQAFYSFPGIWMDVVSGTGKAPEQYRIGVVDTAYFLARQLHVGMRHSLAMLDLVAALIAVFALVQVLRRSAVYKAASLASQWFATAAFIVLVQFYLTWLFWYQRPETLPTAAMLALSLLLLQMKFPLPEPAAKIGTVAGFLLLAGVQGFVRADVGLALHVGILLACLTPAGKGFALPRAVQAGTSVVALMLTAGIQFELMRKMFPHASYGNTPVLQLFFNLRSPSGYTPFLLFMIPVGWTGVLMARRRYEAEASEIGMFFAAAIFMAMWVTVGRIKEVRIFLPFALALAPLTAGLAMQRFLPGKDGSGERTGAAAA